MGKFQATCRMYRSVPSGRTHGPKHNLLADPCRETFTDFETFRAHLRNEHPHYTPPKLSRPSRIKPWKMPSRTTWTEPEAPEIGAWVWFERNGRPVRGQVWSLAPKGYVWVADGTNYYDVHPCYLRPDAGAAQAA